MSKAKGGTQGPGEWRALVGTRAQSERVPRWDSRAIGVWAQSGGEQYRAYGGTSGNTVMVTGLTRWQAGPGEQGPR